MSSQNNAKPPVMRSPFCVEQIVIIKIKKMSELLLVPQLSEKEQNVYEKCLEAFNGLSIKEAENILSEILSKIRTSSVITV